MSANVVSQHTLQDLDGRSILTGHLVRVEVHRNADLAMAQPMLDDLRSNPGVGSSPASAPPPPNEGDC